MRFPPNWDGPQPPPMPDEKISEMLKPLGEENENFKETLKVMIELEKISFEVNQISYHRICGGGAIITAPANGDKTNRKQYDLVCAKCGIIKTCTLAENHEIRWF